MDFNKVCLYTNIDKSIEKQTNGNITSSSSITLKLKEPMYFCIKS